MSECLWDYMAKAAKAAQRFESARDVTKAKAIERHEIISHLVVARSRGSGPNADGSTFPTDLSSTLVGPTSRVRCAETWRQMPMEQHLTVGGGFESRPADDRQVAQW